MSKFHFGNYGIHQYFLDRQIGLGVEIAVEAARFADRKMYINSRIHIVDYTESGLKSKEIICVTEMILISEIQSVYLWRIKKLSIKIMEDTANGNFLQRSADISKKNKIKLEIY